MTPFGIKLKHIREQRHKSLKDLSNALKVTIPYVSMLENGKRGRPADGLIELICSYFNLSWEEADELKFLAKNSDINTKLNSEKLSLNATMLTNVLKNNIKWLTEEQLKNLTINIQDMSKQNKEK